MRVRKGSDTTEVGCDDGAEVGALLMVGLLVGFKVGDVDGTLVGFLVGESDGTLVGFVVGETVGKSVVGTKEMDGDVEGGLVEGIEEGISVGTPDGIVLGLADGAGPSDGAVLPVGELEAEGDMVGGSVTRSLAAAAKSVLAARRTPVSSMDLIVNLKRLSGRLMVVIISGNLSSTILLYYKITLAYRSIDRSLSLLFDTIFSSVRYIVLLSCQSRDSLITFKNAENQNVRVGLQK
jgi:hypothetical protein